MCRKILQVYGSHVDYCRKKAGIHKKVISEKDVLNIIP